MGEREPCDFCGKQVRPMDLVFDKENARYLCAECAEKLEANADAKRKEKPDDVA